jgi:two-component system, NtrC family, sensor kinase
MKVLLIICLIMSGIISFSQNKITDSLAHQLTIVQHDTDRVTIMSALSLSYRLMKPDSSMKYGLKALALAKQIGFHRGEANALYCLAYLHREIGELPKALDLTFKALKIGEENQYLDILASCNTMIGIIYFDLNDYSKSISFYQKAISINMQRGNNTNFQQNLNIAASYLRMNNLDSGKYYLELAYKKGSTIKDNQPFPTSSGILRNYGLMEDLSGNNEEALEYYKRSINTAVIINDYRNTSFNSNELAKFFLKLNSLDSCIFYGEKGLYYAKLGPYNKRILESCILLTEAFRKKGDFKKAFEYQNLMIEAKEGLFSAGSIQAMQTMISEEEARKKELETAKITYQNKLKQYVFISGIGILLLIAFLLYRNNRKVNKARNLLQLKNEEVELTLAQLRSAQSQLIQSEKMASLGELTAGIAHEIQNPLNFVNNFSEVNKELLVEMKDEIDKGNIGDAKEIANDVIANEEKINHHGKRADAIVKGMLQHSQSTSSVKEPTDINALADEYFRLAYHGLRAKDKNFNATLKTEFDHSIGKINIIPQDIGRVLLNMYNNAFYAVTEKQKNAVEGYDSTVSVSTKKVNHELEITVADNGNGIPENLLDKVFQPFFTTKPTGQGTGLGLSLSYDIIKAHQGKISIKNTPGAGAEFIITLPINA